MCIYRAHALLILAMQPEVCACVHKQSTRSVITI